MADDGGRIVIISDLAPMRLLRIARRVAAECECGIEEFRDLDGFLIYDVRAEPRVYGLVSAVRAASGGNRAGLDIEVLVDLTRDGEGRVTIDWFVSANNNNYFAPYFANRLEDEIDVEGRVLESTEE